MKNLVIVGSGQLAQCFHDSTLENSVIFASGVSNSNTVDTKQFDREKLLLLKTLETHRDKKFVYFSSCVLSAPEYAKNAYYVHKQKMENIIKKHSNSYYIFRIPQLFGDLILHQTLINFIYKAIQHKHQFNVYDEAYRYVIEINDVKKIVELCLEHHQDSLIMDLANPYRYKVLDIVKIFEKLLDTKANYKLVHKEDKYILDLSQLEELTKEFNLNMNFGEEYLKIKLQNKIL